MGRSRSRSPRRGAVEHQRRSRSRERERHGDRERTRVERQERHRRSRSRSPRRRSRSPRKTRSKRQSSHSPEHQARPPVSSHDGDVIIIDGDRPDIDEAELEGKTEEEVDMMRVMGFSGFDTTKGKHVKGNDAYATNIVHKRKYRQYMNRRGGFNRPLDFVA